MSNRIQTIAEIIFALTFIAILALLSSGVLSFGQNVNNQISRTNAVTEMHELRAFDNTAVTGATVISAIRNYDSIYNYSLTITVSNSAGTKVYGTGGIESYDASTGFINPADSYRASLVYNSNDVVTGVLFER